jgi:hypothetical protein
MTALVVLRNKAIKPFSLPLNLFARPVVHTTQQGSTAITYHQRRHARRLPRARARRVNIDIFLPGFALKRLDDRD